MMNKEINRAAKAALTLILTAFSISAFSQQAEKPVKNWYNLDLKTDGVFGISMEKTYNELLKGKTADKVIVAVIDGGVDNGHEDLKAVIWSNAKEKAGNKKDDDGNGYADDVHGWNFMGSSKGSFLLDNTDQLRELRAELKKDAGSAKSKSLLQAVNKRREELASYGKTLEPQLAAVDAIIKNMGKTEPTESDFRAYRPRNDQETKALVAIVRSYKDNDDYKIYREFLSQKYREVMEQTNFWLNIDYNPRADKEFEKPFYGNGDVKGEDALHGTHTAGIIAAVRDNGIGMNGVADQVWIMPVRAIPKGEGLDSEIAKAIRYAADNGAKVINMSYGKASSPERKLVDDAVKYAMQKDVLFIHAAGNEGQEQQTEYGYPSRHYLDGGLAEAWIEVGASGPRDDENIRAWFSNYGKQTVDVFAPGVDIYSTTPDNKYAYESGTSMAAPVVSGLAAMIRAYYPKLTAVQVKEIIMKSVTRVNHKAKAWDGASIDFSSLCVSGGVVNAYEAFQLASTY